MSTRYLAQEIDPRFAGQMNTRVTTFLHSFYADNMLGYSSDVQREQQSKNNSCVTNALCFVDNHWKAVFHADFASITTTDEFSGLILLEALLKRK